jgi:putative tryptophan/tyrosine transport system substrate-binding protein
VVGQRKVLDVQASKTGTRLKRRAFVGSLGRFGASANPGRARITGSGALTPVPPRDSVAWGGWGLTLSDSLAQAGWVEGQNIAIEGRSAERHLERLPGLAAELVRLPVDLVTTVSPEATLSAPKTLGLTSGPHSVAQVTGWAP